MRRSAYTLIELVVVMLVVGIMAILAGVAINGAMRNIQLSGAAKKIASDIRFAQSMASSYYKWYGIRFSSTAEATQYSVFSLTGTVETIIADPANANRSMIVNLSTTYPGVTIPSVNIAGGNTVFFNPAGTPYNAKNGTALASEGVITLSNGSATKTVRIAPSTGRVFIQ